MSTEVPVGDNTAPSEPSRSEITARREAEYLRFKHYAAITCLVACPILVALPPRKLDSLTVIQVSAFGMSANYVLREQTGKSVIGHISARITNPTEDLPRNVPSKRAQIVQAKLRELKEAQLRDGSTVAEELEKLQALRQPDQELSQQVRVGSESENWKVKRLQEEQKALDEGKGYGYLIKEYFSDAWPWGKKIQGNPDEENTRG